MLNSRQMENRARLRQMVLERSEPLGVGLKNQCFVGLAIEVAKSNESSLIDYFGGTPKGWKNAIKQNNKTDQRIRNRVMAEYTVN